MPKIEYSSFHSNNRIHSSKAAAAADWAGHKLTLVWSHSFAKLFRVFATSIEPGCYGQQPTRKREIAVRIAQGFGWGVVQLVAIPFGIIGAILRAVASCWRADLVVKTSANAPHWAKDQLRFKLQCVCHARIHCYKQ